MFISIPIAFLVGAAVVVAATAGIAAAFILGAEFASRNNSRRSLPPGSEQHAAT